MTADDAKKLRGLERENGRLKKLRRGGGTGAFAPRMDRHRISFSSASGARSSIVKSIASDCADPNDEGRFRSVSETVGSTWRNVPMTTAGQLLRPTRTVCVMRSRCPDCKASSSALNSGRMGRVA